MIMKIIMITKRIVILMIATMKMKMKIKCKKQLLSFEILIVINIKQLNVSTAAMHSFQSFCKR